MKLQFDEVSPITGNLCVLTEKDPDSGRSVRLCTESGYLGHENLSDEELERMGFIIPGPEDSKDPLDYFQYGPQVTDQFLRLPSTILHSSFTDKNGILWVPMPEANPSLTACLHPAVDWWDLFNDHEEERWGISPIVAFTLPEEEDSDLAIAVRTEMAPENSVPRGRFEHPKFLSLGYGINPDHSITYRFADLRAAKWYDNYTEARRALLTYPE